MQNFSFFFFFSDFIYMKTTKLLFVTKLKLFISALILILVITSCKSIPRETIILSRRLLDRGTLTAEQLADFFLYNAQTRTREELITFAQLYIDEAAAESINSDIAFAQMCHETGFLKFGGLVQPEWHNYC